MSSKPSADENESSGAPPIVKRTPIKHGREPPLVLRLSCVASGCDRWEAERPAHRSALGHPKPHVLIIFYKQTASLADPISKLQKLPIAFTGQNRSTLRFGARAAATDEQKQSLIEQLADELPLSQECGENHAASQNFIARKTTQSQRHASSYNPIELRP